MKSWLYRRGASQERNRSRECSTSRNYVRMSMHVSVCTARERNPGECLGRMSSIASSVPLHVVLVASNRAQIAETRSGSRKRTDSCVRTKARSYRGAGQIRSMCNRFSRASRRAVRSSWRANKRARFLCLSAQ